MKLIILGDIWVCHFEEKHAIPWKIYYRLYVDIQYNTVQYFSGTPLVGLYSDNATNNINIPIKN